MINPLYAQRTPPFSAIAERAVIGAILLSPPKLDEVRSVLPPEAFFIPANRSVFEAMLDVARGSREPDFLQVTEALKSRGLLSQIEGGTAALIAMANEVPTVENLQSYVGIVMSKWRLRGLAALGAEINAAAYDDGADSDEILMRMRSGGASLELTGAGGPIHVGSYLGTALEAIEAKSGDPWRDAVPTGIPSVDKILGGWARKRLHVVAGPPGMGKTAFLNSTIDHAIERDNPCLIVSQEMGIQEEIERFLSMRSWVEARKLHSGGIDMGGWAKVQKGAAKLANLPLYIDDRAIPLPQIVGVCRQWVQRMRALYNDPKKLCVIGIDYAQIIRVLDGKPNMTERIDMIANALKQDVAKAMDCAVVLLSQVVTKLIAREARRPRTDDLYGGALDQAADTISFVWRKPVEADDGTMVVPNGSGPAEFIVGKNKGGKTGSCGMYWIADYMRYVGYKEDDENAPDTRGDVDPATGST